jgi:hypothetical protein
MFVYGLEHIPQQRDAIFSFIAVDGEFTLQGEAGSTEGLERVSAGMSDQLLN